MPHLKDKYLSKLVPELKKELSVDNVMQVPRVVKVVVNMGVGVADKDELKARTEQLAAITGQKPKVCKARLSISNFKLREGMPIGLKVTMRGNRMYEFLERLFNAALPRIRDFRGVSRKALDGRGNYTLGVKDMTIFPEIDPNKVSDSQGMDISIVTSAGDDETARALLRHLGMPIVEK